ncbi:hypothetical protein GGI20_005073 [Coemansia sp. BCRC 34301]|nr:hypothetical protein GGI20_005073 [Coemansia sp. BCRC 34301]
MSHSFIGIHDKSAEARILYLSSGVQHAMGFPPQMMIGSSAYGFITDDEYAQSYPTAYCGDADETSVTVMNINATHSGGDLIATRLVVFSCDTCFLVVAMMFPGSPSVALPTLDIHRMQRGGAEPAVPAQQQQSRQSSVHITRAPHPRACMVVENASPLGLPVTTASLEHSSLVTKPIGPHIVFVTNSISRIIEADGDELIDTPLLRLVAPESLAKTAQFLEDLALTDGVVFSSLFLLERPFVESPLWSGSGNRVEVELVGARSDDGAVLLCRRVRTCSSSEAAMALATRTRHQGRVPGSDDDGYLSLSDLLSSDLETSDCPSMWATTA